MEGNMTDFGSAVAGAGFLILIGLALVSVSLIFVGIQIKKQK
jgi:hypothetical protein